VHDAQVEHHVRSSSPPSRRLDWRRDYAMTLSKFYLQRKTFGTARCAAAVARIGLGALLAMPVHALRLDARRDALAYAMERLGQAPPSNRQLLLLRLMGFLAPPANAPWYLKARGFVIILLLVIVLLAIGFGIVYGIGQAAERARSHGVKVFLEHKNSEPAMKILMRNIGMTLHVIHSLRRQGIDNVLVTGSNRAGMVYRLPSCREEPAELARRLDGSPAAEVVLWRQGVEAGL